MLFIAIFFNWFHKLFWWIVKGNFSRFPIFVVENSHIFFEVDILNASISKVCETNFYKKKLHNKLLILIKILVVAHSFSPINLWPHILHIYEPGYLDPNRKILCYAMNLNDIIFLCNIDRTFQKQFCFSFLSFFLLFILV